MRKERYHGWLIQFIPKSGGYVFQCWLPENRLAVSDLPKQISLRDRVCYESIASARKAAQSRADLEAVKWALQHCRRAHVQGNLNADEYTTLERLILGALTPEPC